MTGVVKITYDAEVNAAYVHLVDSIAEGEAVTQQHSIFTPGNRSELILDYDVDGHLLGIDILHADQILREELLQSAERP